jgi:hypothetical protein
MTATSNVTRLVPGSIPGQLTMPGGERVPVRIAREGTDALQLVLMVGTAGEIASQSQPLLLEYNSSQGQVRLWGKAVAEDDDLVQFLVERQREVVQRRDFVRIKVAQRVRIGRNGDTLHKAFAIDISGGGMLLRGPRTLMLDEQVYFELELGPGQPPITGTGRVVRTAGESERAIAFEEIEKRDRERLIRFIFDCQRAELARTRDGGRSHRRTT